MLTITPLLEHPKMQSDGRKLRRKSSAWARNIGRRGVGEGCRTTDGHRLRLHPRAVDGIDWHPASLLPLSPPKTTKRQKQYTSFPTNRRPVYRPVVSQLVQPSREEGASVLRSIMRVGGRASNAWSPSTRGSSGEDLAAGN